MNSTKKVWYLRNLDLFAPLADDEVARIALLLNDHFVPRGVDLLENRQRDHVFLIKDGAVRITVGEGRSTVALLGPGRLLGQSAFLGNSVATIAATTLTPAYVCETSWPQMLRVLIRHPAVMRKLMASLAQQLLRVETWRERHQSATPTERLRALLCDLADEFGDPVECGRRIPFRLTRAELGQMIGVSRETASRIMAEWERAGFVHQDEGGLTVRLPNAPLAE